MSKVLEKGILRSFTSWAAIIGMAAQVLVSNSETIQMWIVGITPDLWDNVAKLSVQLVVAVVTALAVMYGRKKGGDVPIRGFFKKVMVG